MPGRRITRADVERIARLARIELGEAAVARCARELEAVLEAFADLESLELGEADPEVRPVPLRPDRVTNALAAAEALAGAPAPRDGAFWVPRAAEAGEGET